MDPVTATGLAASIIAVIQLTGALIKPATSSLGPSENDQRELERLLTTMKGFQIAYNNLEQYLKANPGQAETLATAIQQPIADCKAVLAELKLRLSRMTFVRKHIIGKKWDKSFHRLVKRLDDARQLFDVILQGDQSERLIKISQYMEQRTEDFDTIKEGIQSAAALLSDVHLMVQTNQRITEARAAQNQAELRTTLEGLEDKVEEHFSHAEKVEQRKSKDKILQWLAVADPRSNQDRACKSHKSGTGDWFTMGQKYRRWLAEPNSFFWLNGKAGCGKTVLSSTIIEQTAIHCDENEACVLAYFYFSFTDTAKQQCSNMLFSLLEQLASQVDTTPECLASLYRTYQRSTPPLDPLKICLQTWLMEMPFLHVYLIVDALDEIPNPDGREEACKILEELSQNAMTHVLVTSRREHDIIEHMTECKGITDVSIQNLEVDHDILLYVREQLKEDKKLKKWSALHSEIEEVLSRKADGMFRWAACQLDTLRKCPSVKRVREALENLPKTLDETYERILLSIDEDYRDVAVEALRWLCFPTKTMNVAELAEAAVFSAYVESPSEDAPLEISFDVEAFFQSPLDILSLLSGLVVCISPQNDDSTSEEDNSTEDDDSGRPAPAADSSEIISRNSEIVLSHFSVKEYLVSGRLRSEVEEFEIDEGRTYGMLATKCIYVLLYHYSWLEHSETSQKSSYRNGDSFVQHASKYWTLFAGMVDHESELTDLIISVLEAEQCSAQSLLESMRILDKKSSSHTPLYVACEAGLYWPCKMLLERGANVEEGRGIWGNPLHVAICMKHEKIIQLLLDYGAQVNLRYSGLYGSPLQGAAATGMISIVKDLLDREADINIQSGKWGTALQAASHHGHANVVQLLLDREADINIQSGKWGTALQAASHRGHANVVQLLLDHGADINIQGGKLGSALQAAIESGTECTLRLLLEHGANVNTEAGYYDRHFDFSQFPHISTKESLVMILEHGAVMSKFRGGIEAEDALARKDFEQFAEIRMDQWFEAWNRNINMLAYGTL